MFSDSFSKKEVHKKKLQKYKNFVQILKKFLK